MRAGYLPKLPALALAALLGTLVGLGALLTSSRAGAYCLTTTCDTEDSCQVDSDGCSATGIPLHWSSLCLYYGVQRDGSTRREISAEVTADLMEQSFDAWMNADCGSDPPPFVVQSIGEVICDQPEFNCDPDDPNANTVMFRDERWLYDPAALAITTLTVDTRDGTILDADMEVNSIGFTFSVGDVDVNNDLLSVLTHESGHFLGLSHSNVDGSTMYSGYSSRDTSIRSLSPDDVEGICDSYPPETSTLICELTAPDDTRCMGNSECPDQVESRKKKQSKNCSLAVAPGSSPDSSRWPALMMAALFSGIAARRRRCRNS